MGVQRTAGAVRATTTAPVPTQQQHQRQPQAPPGSPQHCAPAALSRPPIAGHTAFEHCAPRPEPVRGGGATARVRPTVDPTITALAVLLADEPNAPQPGVSAQLAARVTMLFALLGARIAALLPGAGQGRAESAAGLRGEQPAPPRVDAPVPIVPPPLQPPPPTGPLLTLDPLLGVIVEPGRGGEPDGDLPEPRPGSVGGNDGQSDTDGSRLVPSSWVPIIGLLRPSELHRRAGGLAGRIRALLAETGITRLQWLLLLLLAPLATAFLIDVVASLLAQQ